MLARILSRSVIGIEAKMIDVKFNIYKGLGISSTVGFPESAVKGSIHRIEAAVKHCGYTFPYKRVTINLAPATVFKEGFGFLHLNFGLREIRIYFIT